MTDQGKEALELLETAEAAVTEIETIEVGEPPDDALDTADDALAELRERTTAHIFPAAPTPIGADVRADFDCYAKGAPVDGYGEFLAQLHVGALNSYLELASFLRSVSVGRRVCSMAAARAAAHGRPDSAEFSVEKLQDYQRLISAQLHERGELEPFARILTEEVPALKARLAAAREPHETRAEADSETARQERLERRAKLVQQFRKLGPNHKFVVESIRNGVRIWADEVANALLGGTWDVHLDVLEAYIDEIATARRRAAGVPA